MKKLLFAAISLDVGGIETALVTLLNYLAREKKYDITLVLERKEGIFLDTIDPAIKIIEYTPNADKNIITRKIKNLAKQIKFKAKYKNKYDFSASYATYSKPDSFVARTASKNSALWVHGDYMTMFRKDKKEYINFFRELKSKKFKEIVFVSETAKNVFIKEIKTKQSVEVIHNLIDYENIIEKSKEQIEDVKKSEIYTFLNVGRHTEEDKRLSRIIEASKLLKQDNLKFRIVMIGTGKDDKDYKKLVSKYSLQDQILFLGQKSNPYPYFKIADSLLTTSEHEGFPVVYIEAMTLGLPILTTEVSDSKKVIQNKYGIVTNKDVDSIYKAMKLAINQGIHNEETFNCEEYNNQIKQKLNILINNCGGKDE